MILGTYDLEDRVANAPRCLRCGRRLRSARSIDVGWGPECWTAILTAARTADLRAWSEGQVNEALELLRDGGITLYRQSHNLIYLVVTRNGASYHFASRQLCTCPAGRWERPCYHRVAVEILLKSRTTARSCRRHRRESPTCD